MRLTCPCLKMYMFECFCADCWKINDEIALQGIEDCFQTVLKYYVDMQAPEPIFVLLDDADS